MTEEDVPIAILDADLRDILAFDERLAALADLIGSIDRPGDYCVHGRLFAPMPRVELADAGVLSFPIPPAQLRALIEASDRAPHGRGQETIVDRSVRDCLQIARGRIDIGGRTWEETLGGIIERAAEGLGCPRDAVAAELYKLLIYEPGGFFAPHRDTEKADGMVATLVIALPVAGAGGELAIRHGGRTTLVDMRTDEPSELGWAAFYADCEHETLPVTQGHRVCLVYNLVLRPGSVIPSEAPDYGAEIDLIAAELEARCRDPEASGKLVWLLEHDYSAAGLSFGTLKNVDAAIVRVLATAAERAECVLHAAILHVEETGSADFRGYAQEVEDIGDDDYEYIEPIDAVCWLDGWVRPDGTLAPYGDLPLLPGELMPAGRLDPGRPDSQRLTEATGNEGATIERLYRRAALVVWRGKDGPRVLARADAASLAAFLAEEWQRGVEGASTVGPVEELALRVVEAWPPPPSDYRRADRESWLRHGAATLQLLCSIGKREAILSFLKHTVLPHYDAGLNGAVVVAAAEIGAQGMREFLCALVRSGLSSETDGVVDLADRLCTRLVDGEDAAWRDALRDMVTAICAEMPSLGGREDGPAGLYVPGPRHAPVPLPAVTLCRFFSLAWRFDLRGEADETAAFFIRRADLAPPDRTIPVLLESLLSEEGENARTGAAFAALWRHAADCLLSRSAVLPRPPADWAIPADRLSCGCEHCAELRLFCAEPDADVHRIPIRKELRAHIRHQIEHAGIDIRCETERRGSPYTLVCVKTRATYERRLRQYREDVAEMRRLVATAEAVPDPAGRAGFLRSAIGKSR